MRAATQEQKAKAAARRERMRGIARNIAAMTPEQRAEFSKRAPIINVEGRELSPFNQAMIATQFPAATIVAGFRQWIAAGRAVRKGEHGASLWVPVGRGKDDDEEQVKPGFILGTVFDVSQTEELTPDQQARAQRAPARDKAPVSLLTHISRMGGIAWGEIQDLTGESRPIARPGLFRKSGNPLDDLATRLRCDGFDIPDDSADGGVQTLRDMIQDELAGRRKHYSFAETERATEQEYHARQMEQAGQELAAA